jgi:hypothetical protein
MGPNGLLKNLGNSFLLFLWNLNHEWAQIVLSGEHSLIKCSILANSTYKMLHFLANAMAMITSKWSDQMAMDITF